jgi:hypothetical protein
MQPSALQIQALALELDAITSQQQHTSDTRQLVDMLRAYDQLLLRAHRYATHHRVLEIIQLAHSHRHNYLNNINTILAIQTHKRLVSIKIMSMLAVLSLPIWTIALTLGMQVPVPQHHLHTVLLATLCIIIIIAIVIIRR